MAPCGQNWEEQKPKGTIDATATLESERSRSEPVPPHVKLK